MDYEDWNYLVIRFGITVVAILVICFIYLAIKLKTGEQQETQFGGAQHMRYRPSQQQQPPPPPTQPHQQQLRPPERRGAWLNTTRTV